MFTLIRAGSKTTYVFGQSGNNTYGRNWLDKIGNGVVVDKYPSLDEAVAAAKGSLDTTPEAEFCVQAESGLLVKWISDDSTQTELRRRWERRYALYATLILIAIGLAGILLMTSLNLRLAAIIALFTGLIHFLALKWECEGGALLVWLLCTFSLACLFDGVLKEKKRERESKREAPLTISTDRQPQR